MSLQIEKRAHPVVTVLKLVAATIVAGLVVGLLALPSVGTAGLAARNGADNFQNISEADALSLKPPERTRILDAKGRELAQFYDYNRDPVKLKQIAPIMQKAVIAIEDSRFYEHGPLDPKGTMRALLSNASSEDTQGGSTLTQQYVKNLLVLNAKTEEQRKAATAGSLIRKIHELKYAINLEKRLTKNQILEGYLNIAFFSSGAYGVEAAARRYFSKKASQLTLPEAALLAGVTKSPLSLNPDGTKETKKAALERRNVVLRRMAELKMVSQQDADKAIASEVKLKPKQATQKCIESKAPYFCTYVAFEVLNNPIFGKSEKARERLLNRGGLTIKTTIDWKAQRAADRAVRRHASPRSRRVAIESMVEPGTGHVKALSVSRKFGLAVKKKQTTINLAANSRHGGSAIGLEAGSTFKIFTLAAAIKEGIEVGKSFKSPTRISVGGMTDCDGDGLENWPVKNAEQEPSDAYNLRTGTWFSVNTFYAQLEKEVGVCKAVEMAEKFGLRTSAGKHLEQVPSQVLGTNRVDMTSLAAAYAGIANRGKYCAPVAITEARDSKGKKLKIPSAGCKQVLDADIADKMNSILKGVFTQGTAKGKSSVPGRPAVGKTGTCEAERCAVFAGHTPNMAAAIWFGNSDRPSADPVTGTFGAALAPAWGQSLAGALQGKPVESFPRPKNNFGDVPPVKVPDIIGLKPARAKKKLEKAGFTMILEPQPIKSSEKKGTVAKTDPAVGSKAEQGIGIKVFISKGGKDGPFWPDNRRWPSPPGSLSYMHPVSRVP